jgi:hypothetical protein
LVDTIKKFGTVEAERGVTAAGAAAAFSGDAGGRLRGQKNHAPATHSRHNKIQYVARERINLSGDYLTPTPGNNSIATESGDDVKSLWLCLI